MNPYSPDYLVVLETIDNYSADNVVIAGNMNTYLPDC